MTILSPRLGRRKVLIALAGAAPALLLARAEAASMPQTAVSYQATPKEGKRCDGCKLFQAPHACKSVAGDIAASGWCKLWVKA